MSDKVPVFGIGDRVRVMQTTSAGKHGGKRGRVCGIMSVGQVGRKYYVEVVEGTAILTILFDGSTLMMDSWVPTTAAAEAAKEENDEPNV